MYHPLDALFDFQRALESRLDSDWLRGATGGTGAFPPINVFQQGDNLVAILEIPGVDKSDLEIQVKDRAIRVSGKKASSTLTASASIGANASRARLTAP